MVSYNNSNVVQCLRQYDMFANSLNLVTNKDERNMIVKQLTKLESKILELTNEIYEEEYYALANKECGLLEEEKARVSMLIDLINQRLSYVEKRCNNHYQLTSQSVDVASVLGTNTLDILEERVNIIDKYSKNIKLEAELKDEVKILTNKIALASEKIEINKSLNVELESSFKRLMADSFEKLDLYDLADLKDEIEYAYYETEKSLTLAELNLETAKTSPFNLLNDCQEMLLEIKKDYVKYKDKLSILKLMELFNREVYTYEELLNKRREVNDLFKYIKNEDFLALVKDSVDKQYNTIMMEQQDVNTYEDLVLEKERKLEALAEIDEENNSEKFQEVLRVLIENERRKQEKILEEQKRLQEEEKKKRLEFERKKQEEILKRQKIIEEARKKEIEKRTKVLLEQQQKSVLQPKKKETTVSFETIKDSSIQEEVKNETLEEPIVKDKELKLDFNKILLDEVPEEAPLFKNKVEIEKELFEEFNDNNTDEIEVNVIKKNDDDDEKIIMTDEDDDFFKMVDKKLPEVSIDEYMKNFEIEENETNTGSLFDDDMFPTIPL